MCTYNWWQALLDGLVIRNCSMRSMNERARHSKAQSGASFVKAATRLRRRGLAAGGILV